MQYIRKRRKEKGLTQAALSMITGISVANISRIENEKIYLYPGWKQKLAKALEVEPDILFQPIESEPEQAV